MMYAREIQQREVASGSRFWTQRHARFAPVGPYSDDGAPSGVAVGQPNAAELYLQPATTW